MFDQKSSIFSMILFITIITYDTHMNTCCAKWEGVNECAPGAYKASLDDTLRGVIMSTGHIISNVLYVKAALEHVHVAI